MISWILYSISLLSNLNNLVSLYICVIIVGAIIFGVGYFIARDFDYNKAENFLSFFKYFKNRKYLIIAPLLFSSLIPNEKMMYIMLANSYLEQKQIPETVQTIIASKLDEIIKDMSKEKRK